MAIILDGTTGITTPGLINTGSETVVNLSTTGTTTLGDASGDALTINSSAVSIPNGLNFDSNTFVIDAANNSVGIGTASPAAKLDVITGTNSGLRVSDGTYTGTFVPSSLGGMAITTGGAYPLIYYINGAERMRIDSSGNVGIGTSSPTNFGSAFKMLAVQGSDYGVIQAISSSGSTTLEMMGASGIGYVGTRTNHPVAFRTNDTERMRIDSSGYVGINTSSPSAFNSYLTSVSTANNKFAGVFYGNAASNDGQAALQVAKSSATNTSSQIFVEFFINAFNTASGRIAANGASAAAFVSYSDRNLKENIVALPSQLGNILALKPSEFDYKDGAGHQIGFIAQEFKEVYPDCVTADNKGILSIVGWSKTEARLVKAIQEQQAIINDLKARIETLESK